MNVYDSFSSDESDLVGLTILEPEPGYVTLGRLPRKEEILYSDTDDVLVLSKSRDILFVDQSRFNTSIASPVDHEERARRRRGSAPLAVDDGTLEVYVFERLCDLTQWTSRDIPSGTGDHEQFRFVINISILWKYSCAFS